MLRVEHFFIHGFRPQLDGGGIGRRMVPQDEWLLCIVRKGTRP